MGNRKRRRKTNASIQRGKKKIGSREEGAERKEEFERNEKSEKKKRSEI